MRSLTRITAAAPSPMGEHMGRVSGSMMERAASTCSTVISSRNWARALRAPWREFFAATMAKWRAVEPWAFMCFFAIMA
ncbi:hypothetical protein D9M68_854520 [compost metagenome]